MITATEPKNSFAAAFEEFEGRLDGGRPWLRELRQAALARFLERGFPTTRDEDWRFTNVSALERTPFRPAAACDLPAQRAMLRALPWDVGGEQMILVNGRYAPDLSTLSAENGVRCGSLGSALATGDGELEDHLAQYADYMDCSFVALNTAFMADGAYVRIPRRHMAERPLHIVHISVPGEAPSMVHPRTLVLVDDEAQASIVESYISLGEGTSFTNAVTELVVGERAQLRHYKLAREALGTYHIGTVQIHQKRDSEVLSHCITLGGGLVRHNINSVLAGAGGHCRLLGLYLVGGDQHVDNHLRVEHVAPHGDSREVFKGILEGRARAVFTGRIVVHRGAQQTDAKQTNKNLMLSGEAQVDSKPQLEIHADDVKCTHGATIGQIDRDALFYLRSRGLSEAAARSLLVYAFASESLAQVEIESLRRRLQRELADRLPQGEFLEALS